MFTLPDLPYDYAALEPYIDTETMHIHHDKHHAAYVKNLNDALVGHEDLLSMGIDDLISDLGKIPEEIRIKVKNNGGGHANHSLFWEIMSGNPKSERKTYGCYQNFLWRLPYFSGKVFNGLSWEIRKRVGVAYGIGRKT